MEANRENEGPAGLQGHRMLLPYPVLSACPQDSKPPTSTKTCDVNFSLQNAHGNSDLPSSTDKARILLTIQDVMVRRLSCILTMKGPGLFCSPAAGQGGPHERSFLFLGKLQIATGFGFNKKPLANTPEDLRQYTRDLAQWHFYVFILLFI